jgi:hypothetical protein
MASTNQNQPLLEFEGGTHMQQIFISVLAKSMTILLKFQLIHQYALPDDKLYELKFDQELRDKMLILNECSWSFDSCNIRDSKVNSLFFS